MGTRRLAGFLTSALAGLALAGCGGDGDGESSAAERWTGTFDTTFGEVEFSADGDRVTGSYEYCGGELEGTPDGDRLTGEWSEDPDACDPSELRDPGAETTGPFEFTLAPDGDSFEGTWRYAGETEDQPWEGTRAPEGEAEPTTTEGEAPEHEISVTYEPPRSQAERIAQRILRVGGTQGVADGFTTSFELPADLTIDVSRGSFPPYYDPRRRTIYWTYGFVDQIAGILQQGGVVRSQGDLGEQLASITSFITVHELGHAFVDVYRIPITGREEDAVDAFATVFMAGEVEGGAEYAFYAARFFALLQDAQGDPNAAQYQDEHSLSIQRSYDIVCAVAGSSRESFRQIARLGILGNHRLGRCPAEFQQKSYAWRTLLEPYIRQEP